jgi:hypothetical protein
VFFGRQAHQALVAGPAGKENGQTRDGVPEQLRRKACFTSWAAVQRPVLIALPLLALLAPGLLSPPRQTRHIVPAVCAAVPTREHELSWFSLRSMPMARPGTAPRSTNAGVISADAAEIDPPR